MTCQNYPITRPQILDSSKLKEFADDNFKFDKNGRKLSKWVENTAGKGEIARYEQFLLFPQCFQKFVSQGRQKVSLSGNGLKHLLKKKVGKQCEKRRKRWLVVFCNG